MYCAHYGLVRRPFEMTPDPAFLYLGETHREGLATLVYGVQSGKGFVLLTGEVGTGKTTLLHALLGQLEADTASAFPTGAPPGPPAAPPPARPRRPRARARRASR